MDDAVKVISKKFELDGDFLNTISEGSVDVSQWLTVLAAYILDNDKKQEEQKTSEQSLRKQRLNAEHQLSQLEKQLIVCNTKLTKYEKGLLDVKTKLSKKEDEMNETETKFEELAEEKKRLFEEHEKLKKKYSILNEEKVEFSDIVETKNREIDRLNEEWKTISNKLAESNKTRCEIQYKLDEIKNSDVRKEFKEKRLEQEKKMLLQQLEQVSADLRQKTESANDFQKDKTAKLLDLESKYEICEQENLQLKQNVDITKKTCKELENKIDTLMMKMKRASEEHVETENNMQQELTAQTKLVQLYKDDRDHAKSKLEEVTTAVVEMQGLMKQTSEEKAGLEAKLKAEEEINSKLIAELKEKLREQSQELENANDLLQLSKRRVSNASPDDISILSPMAAATSKILKKGMTLTQIYSEYVKVSDELLAEKDENSRLKMYMEQILKEVEEKAPLLMQQKEDYEHAKQTIESMSAKLQENIKECHRLQTEHMELERKVGYHKREEKRLKALSFDLSQQVCVLLKEVEEARGGVVSTSDKLPELASTDTLNMSSSGQVISEHLVTFKSIEELQSQNERLLLTVRELSEEQEKLEQEGGSEIIHELKKKIENANGDLEALKQNQKTQDDMMEKLCRQRDIYKALCQKGGVMVGDVSSTSQASTTSILETETELTMAKAELDNSISQHEKLKESVAEKEKVWNQKQTKQDEELSLLRLERDNLKNQISFADEKYSILKTTSEGYRKEVAALEGKCKSITDAQNKLRVEAEKYKQDYHEAKEKLVAAEVSVKSSETEKHLHKEAEKRLMQENQSLLDQQRSQNVLLTNLQSIQNNLERQEFETRKTFTKQVEILQREIRCIRRQSDNDLNLLKVTNTSLEQEMKELKIRLAVELETKKNTSAETQSSKQHIEQLEAKCKELDGLYQASENRLNEILQSDATAKGQLDTEREIERLKTKARELELVVSNTTTEKKAVESQLETAKKHLEQYQEIANSNEQAIKVINEKLETQTIECEKKLGEADETVNSVKSQIASVVAEKIQMKKSAEEADKKYQALISELRTQSAPLEKRLQEVTRALVNAKEQEASAVRESKEQVKVAKEASEKYERELVLHAKDVEQLTLLKEELHNYKSKYGGVAEQLSDMKQTLQNNELLMEQMKEHHSQELRKGETARKDLINQNAILHSQVEKLATAAAAAAAKSSSKLPEDTTKTTDKSLEEVYELLRFVRREKEIAETKSEASATESMRYRQRADHLQRDLEETKAALELELERTKGRMLTEKEHADMMEKLKKFTEYEELNKNLEKQKNENLQKFKSTQEKVKKLEADMKPLQENKKTLENEKSIWLGEKTALKAEIERWTARTNQLMAQNVKADTEEVKKLLALKTQNEKTISTLQDDVKRTRQQLELLRRESLKLKAEKTENQNKILSLQNELSTAQGATNKGDNEQTETEQSQLKKDLETKMAEIKKDQKTIQQLKKLARKYKGQADKLQKRLSDNKIEFSDILNAPVSSAETAEVAPVPPTQSAVDPEEKKKLEDTISQKEKEIAELNSTVLKLQEKCDVEQKLNAEKDEKFSEKEKSYIESEKKLQALSSEVDQLKKALKEEKEKQDRNRKLVKTAKDKINSLTKLKDTKTQEIETITKQNEDLKNRIQQLTDSDQIPAATQELKLRITSLEKQVEGLLKEKALLTSKCEELQLQYEQLLQEKKRATEKLIKANQQKTRVQSSSTSTVEVPTVATTESSAPLTATVRPTATSAQPSKFHAQVTTTPTASIRPLAHAAPTAMISPTVPVSTTPTPIASVSALPISANVQPQVAEVQGRPSTSRPLNERPGTSFKAPVAVVTVQSQELSSEDSVNELNADDVQLTSSENNEPGPSSVADVQPPPSAGASSSTKRSHSQLEDGGQQSTEETDSLSQAGEDEEPGTKRQRVDANQATEEQLQPFEVDSQEVLEEDELLGEATEDGDDEVLETAPQTHPDTQSTHVGVSREVRLQVERTLQPSPQELLRQRSNPRGRSQLPSFSLMSGQGGSGFYEETDDSTVPSTPTLFMPKRTDGFAEAVSSPLIRLPTFSFTTTDQSGGSTAPSLEQTGLQLNETRVDLLGSEDQANVPQTPLSIVPSVSSNELTNVQAVQQQPINRAAGSSEPVRHDAFFSEDNGQEQNVPQQIDLTEDDDDDIPEQDDDDDDEGDFDDQAEYEEEEEEEEDDEVEEDDDDDEVNSVPAEVVAEMVSATTEEPNMGQQPTQIYVPDDEQGYDFAAEEVNQAQSAGDEDNVRDVEEEAAYDGGYDEVVEINAEESIDVEFPDPDDNKIEVESEDVAVIADEKSRDDEGASTSVVQREGVPEESSSSSNRGKTEDKTKPVRLQRSRGVRPRIRRIPEEQTKPSKNNEEAKPN